MRTRTLSQQILAVSVVGVGVAIAKDIAHVPVLFLVGGVALLIFSASLFVVDWHYQSAFTAIRNSLARIESRQSLRGPWIAHLRARTHFNDHIASYLPFLLLAVFGCAGISYGVFLPDCDYVVQPWIQWTTLSLTVVLLLGVGWFFGSRCYRAATKDKEMQDEIGTP